MVFIVFWWWLGVLDDCWCFFCFFVVLCSFCAFWWLQTININTAPPPQYHHHSNTITTPSPHLPLLGLTGWACLMWGGNRDGGGEEEPSNCLICNDRVSYLSPNFTIKTAIPYQNLWLVAPDHKKTPRNPKKPKETSKTTRNHQEPPRTIKNINQNH